MTTDEIRVTLLRKAMELGVIVTGVHSVRVEDGIVYAMYDVTGPGGDDVLLYEFPFPALISREELGRFSQWLAAEGFVTTAVH